VAATALVLVALWGVLAFGVRAVIQYRRTGETGFRGFHGRPGSAEWWGGVLFALATAALVLAPVVDLLDLLEPVSLLDHAAIAGVGVVLTGLGIVATLVAQLAMGASWRVGVDPDERTDLVTEGPFRVVRNPIFSTMLVTAVGLALMVPNALALAGVVMLVVGLELHVRRVEEPYLRTVHREDYQRYAARVGRFVPGVGLLPPCREELL
jgi:protein-S-isoprenylcysteine O-methyltransferase Ste14